MLYISFMAFIGSTTLTFNQETHSVLRTRGEDIIFRFLFSEVIGCVFFYRSKLCNCQKDARLN